jgi:L-cysteate sulfo-lyase
VAGIATDAARLLEASHRFEAGEVSVNDDYLGGGYAAMGEPEREAIRTVARCEGLLLDPVYTGRAAAGLLDLIRRGAIGPHETILFWHTGGMPALWAYQAGLAGG